LLCSTSSSSVRSEKAEDQKKYRESLQKGQGSSPSRHPRKIVEIQETTCTIEVEGGNRLKIEESAVATDAQDQLPGIRLNNSSPVRQFDRFLCG
jgi:hypothetical protein